MRNWSLRAFAVAVRPMAACALLGLYIAAAGAQTPAAVIPTAADGAPGLSGAAEYRLGPEDVVAITVVNFPNLSVPQATVAPDGRLSLPLLGPVTVTGQTTSEAAALLVARWRKYVVDPSVTVSLVQQRRREVVVYGFVQRPGTLEYRAPLYALDALAKAGGALSTGDLSRVTVTRRSGAKEQVNLSHPETRGGTEANVLLGPDDTIYVPEQHPEFSVVGEVLRPGSYDYKEDMTVLDALTQVGGVRQETADLSGAVLTHDNQARPVDLEALLRRGDMVANVRMAPGDQLLIPEAKNRTYVFGAVARPGYYLFKADDRVLDALNGCGGPLREANLGEVTLVRIDREHNTATTEKLDVGRFMTKGDTRYNVALSPGDVLYIPDKRRSLQAADLVSVFQAISIAHMGSQLLRGR